LSYNKLFYLQNEQIRKYAGSALQGNKATAEDCQNKVSRVKKQIVDKCDFMFMGHLVLFAMMLSLSFFVEGVCGSAESAAFISPDTNCCSGGQSGCGE